MHTEYDKYTDAEFARELERFAALSPIIVSVIKRLTDGREDAIINATEEVEAECEAKIETAHERGRDEAIADFEATRPKTCDHCDHEIDYDV